ncbi:phosphatidylinositol 4,5-bisphosphate 3-kinase catalytic subunit gamma isoform isoform X2 [Petromyzon marinus]|uniref:phosphatidylinositol 4,5-bisphosphate 3-kinase catalytic subunit gamma isoform isoform X2 n=1 Tax=Petromyzon marinus TaxID=7757 RepID=UPI003F6F15F6
MFETEESGEEETGDVADAGGPDEKGGRSEDAGGLGGDPERDGGPGDSGEEGGQWMDADPGLTVQLRPESKRRRGKGGSRSPVRDEGPWRTLLGGSSGGVRALAVEFVLPTPRARAREAERVVVAVPLCVTVERMRALVWARARLESEHPRVYQRCSADAYSFLYRSSSSSSSHSGAHGEDGHDDDGGTWFEIFDPQQLVHSLHCFIRWMEEEEDEKKRKGEMNKDGEEDVEEQYAWSPGSRRIHVLERSALQVEESPQLRRELDELVGVELSQMDGGPDEEVFSTRRQLDALRRTEVRDRDPLRYALDPRVVTCALPGFLPLRAPGGEIFVTLHHGACSQKMKVGLDAPPQQILAAFLRKVAKKGDLFSLPEGGGGSGSLALKVCGRAEYLVGDSVPLRDFHYIRSCLRTPGTDIHLAVVELPDVEEDAVEAESWPLVDEGTGQTGTHEQLSLAHNDHEHALAMSLWDCGRRFRVKVVGVEMPARPRDADDLDVFVEVCIYHGQELLSAASTQPKPLADEEVLWNQRLEFDIRVRDLPREARLSISLHGVKSSSQQRGGSGGGGAPDAPTISAPSSSSSSSAVGEPRAKSARLMFYVNLQLIDHRCLLRQGEQLLHMWRHPERGEDMATIEADKLSSEQNPERDTAAVVCFLLDSYAFRVALPRGRAENGEGDNDCCPESVLPPGSAEWQRFENLVNAEPLGALSAEDRALLWRHRALCATTQPHGLPKLLRSVRWSRAEAVQEAHRVLARCDPARLGLDVALQLLDCHFADAKARGLAVRRLELLGDDHVQRYLLQLVQALKFEPYHDSDLARFLIRCGLRSKRVGHFVFWFARGECASSPRFSRRFSLLLEALVRGAGRAARRQLQAQLRVVNVMRDLAVEVKRLVPDRTDIPPSATAFVKERLQRAELPPTFRVPYDPTLIAGSIQVDKCKIMASKKKPLWLEFSSGDPTWRGDSSIAIIFKHGDDLRQDMLILQILVIMESIWESESLDLGLLPYGCISTGDKIGMIEVVRDATTIAQIQQSRVGNTGAFRDELLHQWLRDKCPIEAKYTQALERFVQSCAGYCVATYVLGIGDRHNDNIMIRENGNLFHIDFGHILGNTKSFLGISRERVPFVLTPDMLYVMGVTGKRSSAYFCRFQDTCASAYLALRRHTNLLLTLLSMMALTGMPELSCRQDAHYVREALTAGRPGHEAQRHFLDQVELCREKGWTVQLAWFCHLVLGVKQGASSS